MSDFDTSEVEQFSPVSSFNDNSQTICLIFFKNEDDDGWQNDTVNFDRVPQVGEYFALSRDSDWFEVKAVVHMGFPLDYDAELYAVRVDDRISLRQQFAEL